MSLYYIDTSAALKFLAEEPHSKALASFYDSNPGASWVSSALLRIELIRAVGRVMAGSLPEARTLLHAFNYLSMDDEVVDGAMNEPDRMLRSLDSIHLASARLLGEELDGLVTYDDRLATAATDAGITVIAPRD
ncbi:type II toxin-antitoxin system VapC family toxin [Kineosporia sp. NBRC 101731]|uniref:type II toxin-antitoxin system VapC family toxin n=1 Tax=Kineosporia sp. NBRC 101731 TaxID=3032199 RepID=UPI0024A045F1|nr:type II toxin-antitoxin system VapC family toxin [Kineosporia sp. NBRC 101731]GLY28952.1 ribonuclease VapC [Kineosporia sp. NBRC 101731]